ncbi:MAG: acyl-CoA/acyl-ACP dehydrogenase [Ignavibacteria bacterium]|nr:acyl-CoA/acyl-ACP dehydrogenase [Ignavibacteria bacterium]
MEVDVNGQSTGLVVNEDLINRCKEVSKGFPERSAKYDREASFPVENFEELRDAGLYGIMVPKEFGGFGADFLTYTKCIEQIGKADSSTGLTFNMHNITVGSLSELDSEINAIGGSRGRVMGQFREWMYNQAIVEKKLFASAVSEPGIGAHFSKLKTTYRKVDGGFIINGTKWFVSMAGYADYYVVAARNEKSSPEDPSLSYLVVEKENPGITIDRVWDTLGMRATTSDTMHLKDVFVPTERLFLGSEGMVLYKITREPHWLVGGFTGVYLGISSAAFEFMVDYLSKKKIPGTDTPMSTDSRIQQRVGELAVQLGAARSATYEAARLIVEQRGSLEANTAIHRAKFLCGELGPHLTSMAIRTCGGTTIARRLPLEKLYRDSRCGGLMPATSDECLMYVGKAALGIDMTKTSETYW